MQLFIAIVIGLAALVFQPEITGVPTINVHAIIPNGSLANNGTFIHDANGVCPAVYDAPALPQYIRDGIVYVQQKSNCTAGVTAGSIFCQRVSCSYNSAIYVCNESDQAPVSPACNAVADHAQFILDNCDTTTMGQHIVQGQVGDIAGGYYVSVGYGDC
ncbi:hypothetical protein PG996_007512 [Apiospora saccharicola]|uniref:Secreted protein n=1 Tax=Apiospora saccharicola TaxID=335842 RepID=A0ABR1VB17_9PEZI